MRRAGQDQDAVIALERGYRPATPSPATLRGRRPTARSRSRSTATARARIQDIATVRLLMSALPSAALTSAIREAHRQLRVGSASSWPSDAAVRRRNCRGPSASLRERLLSPSRICTTASAKVKFQGGAVVRSEIRHAPPWVETTHQRGAAYGHRTFNAGFLAMNPKGRPSQADPLLPLGISNWWPQCGRSKASFEQHQTSTEIDNSRLRLSRPARRAPRSVKYRQPPCRRPAGPGPTRARTAARTTGPSRPPPPRSSRSTAP